MASIVSAHAGARGVVAVNDAHMLAAQLPLYRQQACGGNSPGRVSLLASGRGRGRRGAVRVVGSIGERGSERKSATPSVTTGAALSCEAPPGRVRREKKKATPVMSETDLASMVDTLHCKPSIQDAGAQLEGSVSGGTQGKLEGCEAGRTDSDAIRAKRMLDGSSGDAGSSRTSRWDRAEQIAAVSKKSMPKPKAKAAAEGDAKPKKRVPWNKGLKHSEATKAKIRERTAAAMKRPEIIAKLQESGHKQRHSDETKAKISAKIKQRYALAKSKKEAALKAKHGPNWREMEEAEKQAAKEAKLAAQRAKRAELRAAKAKLKAEIKASQNIRPSREYKSPTHRAKISAAIRAKWQDSSYRQKVCAGMQDVVRTRPTPGARRSQQPSVYTPRNKKPLTPAQKEERERKAALAAQVKMKEQLRNRASMMLAEAERAARTLERKAETTGLEADHEAAVSARQSLETARATLQASMGNMVPGGAEEEEWEEEEWEEEEEEEGSDEDAPKPSPPPRVSTSSLAKGRGIIMPGDGN